MGDLAIGRADIYRVSLSLNSAGAGMFAARIRV